MTMTMTMTMETMGATTHTTVMAAMMTMMAAMMMMMTTVMTMMVMTMTPVMTASVKIMIMAFASSRLVIRSTSPSSAFLSPPRSFGFAPKTAQSLSHTGGRRKTKQSGMTGSSKNNSVSSSRVLTTPTHRTQHRTLPVAPIPMTLPSRPLSAVARIFARVSSQRHPRLRIPPGLGE